MNISIKVLSVSALALASALAVKPVMADTLTATYYTISSTDPDANHLGGGLVTNEVQQNLGPNGLPVLNTAAYGCVSNCFSLAAPGNQTATSLRPDGEITYWDPVYNPYVTQTSSVPVTLPFVDDTLFPPNGTGSSDGGTVGFQALKLTGTINAPTTEQLNFTISSDDMAFVYIDGALVCSDGGIHGLGSVPCTTPTITSGDHSFALFFVDLNVVASGLEFTINTTGVTTTGGATPEPSTFIMLGTGLLGAAGTLRRRFRS
jgi:hypothetical protein